MTGTETVKILRNMINNKEIPPIKLAISSANNSESDVKSYIQSGIDIFLEKPIKFK